MCLGEVQVQIDCLNSDNIIGPQTYRLRRMDYSEDLTESELKLLHRDKAFRPILNGGVLHCHLKIRCQVAEESGRLIYNGRPFNRSQWSWRPPKIIRLQGRSARELSDPINNKPEISIITARGEVLRLDACPCGGELQMDNHGYLYCVKCNMIYE